MGCESFNNWGGRGCRIFVPVLAGNGTKKAPPGETFGQPPGIISSNRGELADHVGDHVVLSPEGAVLVTYPGTESSYPRPPPIVERLVCLLDDLRVFSITPTSG